MEILLQMAMSKMTKDGERAKLWTDASDTTSHTWRERHGEGKGGCEDVYRKMTMPTGIVDVGRRREY